MRLVLALLLLVPAVALAQQGETEPITEACSTDPEIGFWYGGLFIDTPEHLAGEHVTGGMVNTDDVTWGDTTGLIPPGVSGTLIIARDPGEPGEDEDEGCTPLTNADEIDGNVALIRRGACPFSLKALHAQLAGAVGFVVYNDERMDFTDYQIVNMAPAPGTGEQVIIPGLFVSRYLGNMIVDAIEDEEAVISVNLSYHRDCFFHVPPTNEENVIPGRQELSAPYPNPFIRSTRFDLTLDKAQHVSVEVFDVLGHHVATLHDGPLTGGATHTFVFEAGTLPAGVYVVRAEGEAFAHSRRVVLAR